MLLPVAVLLAAVFAVAAVAKLVDRDGVRQVAAAFGAPAWALLPLSWLLPIAELGTALLLAVTRYATAGAVAALALLVAFTAAVTLNLRRGRRPPCHCFGRLHAAPLGWSTVARNGLLAAAAGFVAGGGRAGAPFAATAAACALAWALLARREKGPVRRGRPALPLTLDDRDGRAWRLEALLAFGRPLLLVFSASGCPACARLLADVERWQDEVADRLTVAVVRAGPPDGRHDGRLQLLLVDPDHAASRAYGISATPSAVLIGADGTVAAAPVAGAAAIGALVERTAGGAGGALRRRGLLVRAAGAGAAVTLVPLVATASATARNLRRALRPKALKIDGAWLCDQRYALCTSARCVSSPSDPDVAICRCKVKHGYSVGFKSCDERAPRGRTLHSNFSLQDVDARTRVLKCSARGLWVQCLDVVCQVDPDRPRRAHCRCVKMETEDFFTFGGDCDTDTCSTVIWSATTAPFPGGAQYEKGMKRLGLRVRSPKSCPASASRSGR